MYSTLINHNHICLLEAAFIWFIEKLLHFRERVIHLSTDLPPSYPPLRSITCNTHTLSCNFIETDHMCSTNFYSNLNLKFKGWIFVLFISLLTGSDTLSILMEITSLGGLYL